LAAVLAAVKREERVVGSCAIPPLEIKRKAPAPAARPNTHSPCLKKSEEGKKCYQYMSFILSNETLNKKQARGNKIDGYLIFNQIFGR